MRKGTSLHRVHFAAAKKYNVDILNTSGVNAPFVAQFITDQFLVEGKSNMPIGIIGIGDIGKKVTETVIKVRNHVLLLIELSIHLIVQIMFIVMSF